MSADPVADALILSIAYVVLLMTYSTFIAITKLWTQRDRLEEAITMAKRASEAANAREREASSRKNASDAYLARYYRRIRDYSNMPSVVVGDDSRSMLLGWTRTKPRTEYVRDRAYERSIRLTPRMEVLRDEISTVAIDEDRDENF